MYYALDVGSRGSVLYYIIYIYIVNYNHIYAERERIAITYYLESVWPPNLQNHPLRRTEPRLTAEYFNNIYIIWWNHVGIMCR